MMPETNLFEVLRDALVEDLLKTIDAFHEDVPYESVKLSRDEQLEQYAEHREDPQYWEHLLDTEGWQNTIHDAQILERRYRSEQDADTTLDGELDFRGDGDSPDWAGGPRHEPTEPLPGGSPFPS